MLRGRNTKYGNNEILNVIPVIRTGKLSAWEGSQKKTGVFHMLIWVNYNVNDGNYKRCDYKKLNQKMVKVRTHRSECSCSPGSTVGDRWPHTSYPSQ
jgi:hypothetical protein